MAREKHAPSRLFKLARGKASRELDRHLKIGMEGGFLSFTILQYAQNIDRVHKGPNLDF